MTLLTSFEGRGVLPGQSDSLTTPEGGDICWGPAEWNRAFIVGCLLDHDARDLGSNPSTLLRAGLLMGVTSDKAATTFVCGAGDGSGSLFGILIDSVHVTDELSSRFCRVLVAGHVKSGSLIEGISSSTLGSWIGNTNDAAIRLLMADRFILDDQFFQ